MRLFPKIIGVLVAVILVFGVFSFVSAKKPSASFDAPDEIKAGENFILTINIVNTDQSEKDYVNKVKLSTGVEPLKIWTYTASTASKEAEWSEKLNLTLNKNTVIVAEVTTNKNEIAKKDISIEIVSGGSDSSVDKDVTTEPVGSKEEETRGLGFTFWIFISVIMIVLVGVVVYMKRKRKGLL